MGMEQMDALLDALVDEEQRILSTVNLVWERMHLREQLGKGWINPLKSVVEKQRAK